MFRRWIRLVLLVVILALAVIWWSGGENIRWFGQKSEETGKAIHEKSEEVAEKADRLKEGMEKKAEQVQEGVERLKELKDAL